VWYNIYSYLSEEKHLNVVLSNPVKTRAIASAKIKTDNLLRGGYIVECYVPDRRIMDLRELVRHRTALVRMRTKLKNKIHSIILMKGIQISSKHCSFTHLYNEELKELNDYRINGYLHLIESLDSEIKGVSKLFYINVDQYYYPHAYHEVGLEVGLGRISPPFFHTLFHEEHPVGE